VIWQVIQVSIDYQSCIIDLMFALANRLVQTNRELNADIKILRVSEHKLSECPRTQVREGGAKDNDERRSFLVALFFETHGHGVYSIWLSKMGMIRFFPSPCKMQ
jgi:hypothetical protein